MDWLWYFLLLGVMLLGLMVNILGLPGLWLLVAAAAGYAWVTGFGVYVGWAALGTLIALGIIAEIVEFIAGGAGAKLSGGSKRAMLGGIIGAVIGSIAFTPLFPVIGTIFGACLGAFVGSAVVELYVRGSLWQAARVGTGAAKGRFWGIIYKSVIGGVMFLVGMITALPLGAPAPLPLDGPAPPPVPAPAPAPAALLYEVPVPSTFVRAPFETGGACS